MIADPPRRRRTLRHNRGMRQILIDEFGSPDVLRLEEAPLPIPEPGELMVRVRYAGLNPIDYKMRDGSSPLAKSMTPPTSLGREFVGEIAAAADDIDLTTLGLAVGDAVFGMRPHEDLRGCYAEFITISAGNVAPVPSEATAGQLAAYGGLALAGLTALTAVEDCAKVADGDLVLIHGGAGGVGQLLVPLAKAAGAAKIWATARAENADRIRQLGATPISYDEADWQETIDEATDGGGVDVIIDTHYFSTFVSSLDHLRGGGRIVVLPTLADVTPAKERGIDVSIPSIRPNRERLGRLAEGLSTGELTVEVSEIVPLAEVARAHEQLESGHTRGKLILDLQ